MAQRGLPRLFGFPWEEPEPTQPSPSLPPVHGANLGDDYILVMKRRPTRRPKGPGNWLAEHQERFRQVHRIALEQTAHLKGSERMIAIGAIKSRLLKARNQEERSAPS